MLGSGSPSAVRSRVLENVTMTEGESQGELLTKPVKVRHLV